ncbi:hypothetical protein ASD37_01515 [Mycobacterium sp. Root135]|nr:hypothetical protein ASD37_01515 [Mycobacterium sp. Root135]
MPLCKAQRAGDGGNMFYKRVSRTQKIRRTRTFRLLSEMAAGIHAANGLAHGVQPSAHSPARYSNKPE